MRAVKSRAAKQNIGLTVPQATRQARAVADQLMPGQGVTVESRRSHDTDTDTPTIVTYITFPEAADASDVACAVESLAGHLRSTWSTCSITITRAAR
jgi:hypothetical protein